MMQSNDPFSWRSGPGKIYVGSDEEGAIVDMIEIDGQLFCIKKKSIHSISLADSIDPKRTNPQMLNSQQKVFVYGADEAFVGRTILQANKLFEKHSLPISIDCSKGVSIAFSFLKEVAPLHEALDKYVAEEKEKDSQKDDLSSDTTLKIPSIDGLDQQIKQQINGIDHAVALIIKMVQLFYPSIKNANWSGQVIEELKKKLGTEESVQAFQKIRQWSSMLRNMRNAIEHPKTESRIVLNNYVLKESGLVRSPTIAFINNDTPLPEIPVLKFMEVSYENLLSSFELAMAILCDIHALPFAGTPRSVMEIPVPERPANEAHINFGYNFFIKK